MYKKRKEKEKIIPRTTSMIIKYLKCRANLSFDVYFRSNDTIRTVATSWDLILLKHKLYSITCSTIYRTSVSCYAHKVPRFTKGTHLIITFNNLQSML